MLMLAQLLPLHALVLSMSWRVILSVHHFHEVTHVVMGSQHSPHHCLRVYGMVISEIFMVASSVFFKSSRSSISIYIYKKPNHSSSALASIFPSSNRILWSILTLKGLRPPNNPDLLLDEPSEVWGPILLNRSANYVKISSHCFWRASTSIFYTTLASSVAEPIELSPTIFLDFEYTYRDIHGSLDQPLVFDTQSKSK
jgi:hypothetical protein